jgi:anti-sigma B factor antagonist
MDIKVDCYGRIKALRPQGNIRFGEGADLHLRNAFDQQASDGTRMFVLDLRHVKYMDSNSLGQLVAALHHMHELGGDIKLFGLQKKVIDAMVLVRLNELFEIYDEEHQAVASYVH